MTEKRKSLIKQIWEAMGNGREGRWGTIQVKSEPANNPAAYIYFVIYVSRRVLASYSMSKDLSKPILLVFGENADYKVFRELTDEAIECMNKNIDRIKKKASEFADNSWKASESWKRCRRAAQKEEKRYNRIFI